MLYLGELLFHFGDFVVFQISRQGAAPFRKGLLPFYRREIGPAGLGVNIAEMRANGGIVALPRDGLAKSGFRLCKFVLPEVNPPEAVQISAAVRLFLQGALNKSFRFIQPNAEIPKHIAVVIEYRAVPGVYR